MGLGRRVYSRNFGGGFNNATIHLVPIDIAENFKAELAVQYAAQNQEREGHLTFFDFNITPGAGVLAKKTA